jgi:hypothetical protein
MLSLTLISIFMFLMRVRALEPFVSGSESPLNVNENYIVLTAILRYSIIAVPVRQISPCGLG